VANRVRCASHPSRPAVDACPRCDRPRCGVDATGDDCPLCAVAPAAVDAPAPPVVPQVLLALLGSGVVAFLAAFVCAEYVEAGFLQYVVPLVTGVLCGAAGLAAARSRGHGAIGAVLRGLTCVSAVAGVAYGFHLEASQDLLTGSVYPAYALAVLGALGWTHPVKRRAAV